LSGRHRSVGDERRRGRKAWVMDVGEISRASPLRLKEDLVLNDASLPLPEKKSKFGSER